MKMFWNVTAAPPLWPNTPAVGHVCRTWNPCPSMVSAVLLFLRTSPAGTPLQSSRTMSESRSIWVSAALVNAARSPASSDTVVAPAGAASNPTSPALASASAPASTPTRPPAFTNAAIATPPCPPTRNGGKLPAHFAHGTRIGRTSAPGGVLLLLAGASYQPEEGAWG